ncbi:(+)-delta-cadinene synthase [Platanthera zijinensis]|uniref:(+)-delta-cadinene synthase n=1 Tax=Platanthera zijinensis TaxID=2320716 RepID=A0AAP0BEU4_9ASPA
MEAIEHSVTLSPQPGVFQSNAWGDFFLTVKPIPSTEHESLRKRIEELKDVIRKKLKDVGADQLRSLEMIDAIQHLGVAYHFGLEIDEALERIQKAGFHRNNDPHTVALGFRLLKQRRFPISSDIFNKFIDQNGNLADNMKPDAKTLLSIYDARFLGIPGEQLLEKATNFTRTHLKLLVESMDPSADTTVSRALETPRFRRMERLESREYLQVYGQEKNRNEKLFELEKLDFHLVQSIHLEELQNLTL